ncbi:MAG: rRNA maturation RNase YbeY [Betaproteobacteria bacterium]|jgi:probable rRNA maturation factor|nr:rRNA maturation RNase YbeY [Betaproteobacteria bacterium]
MMAKETGKPQVIVTDSNGKSSKSSVGQIEVDFGGDRRLLFLFSETGGYDLEIEAVATSDRSAPVISVQPCASNVISLRVDVPNDSSAEDGDIPVVAGPMLNLSVQKAVEGADRDNAPRKHQVRRWAQAALLQDVEVTVRLVGETESRALNKNYRGKDCATNVLTFAYGGKKGGEKAQKKEEGNGEPMIGDLVLCVPVVAREASEQGKALDAHFAHLVVHGMLHLQGFDHRKKADATAMEAREREILGALGYADPYVV